MGPMFTKPLSRNDLEQALTPLLSRDDLDTALNTALRPLQEGLNAVQEGLDAVQRDVGEIKSALLVPNGELLAKVATVVIADHR